MAATALSNLPSNSFIFIDANLFVYGLSGQSGQCVPWALSSKGHAGASRHRRARAPFFLQVVREPAGEQHLDLARRKFRGELVFNLFRPVTD